MRRISSLIMLQFEAVVTAFDTDSVRQATAQDANADRIHPSTNNPRYWQYKGKPVFVVADRATTNEATNTLNERSQICASLQP